MGLITSLSSTRPSTGPRLAKEHWKGLDSEGIVYPKPPSRGGVVETIHGVEIKDPWRALEVLESEESDRFIAEQNQLSKPYLHSHPLRAQLEESVAKNYEFEKTSCPMLQGDGYYYWTFNDGTRPRDVMVRSRDLDRDFGKPPARVQDEKAGAGPELVFDPDTESNVSLYAYSWSPSGRYWNAILQESGSDWQKIRTYDTHTMTAVDEDLTQAKFTFGACFIGEQGFLYKKAIAKTDKISDYIVEEGQFGTYYHQLGTSQAEDWLVWCGTGPDALSFYTGRPHVLSADAAEGSGRRSWVLFDIYRNTNPEAENFIIELPLDLASIDLGLELNRLVKEEKKYVSKGYSGMMTYVGTLSSDCNLFLSTDDGYTTGRIVALDAADFDAGTANGDEALSLREIVPAHPEGLTLNTAKLIADKVIVLAYFRHACAAVEFVDARSGKTVGSTEAEATEGDTHAHVEGDNVVLPKNSSVSHIEARSDNAQFYLAVESYVATPCIIRGRVEGESETVKVSLSRVGVNAAAAARVNEDEDELVCRQVFYTSHDGVEIPLFIAHAADLDLSVPQPTLLHAYGGFAVPMVPTYSPFFVAFMRQLRGIVAIACIRGGGEYGKSWHEAAMGLNRPVGWEDFACAARYLQERSITTPALTAIYGTSNGGLLVTCNTNRNPHLFAVVFADVAVTDLLRFHKFTIGRLWVSEYGNPEDAHDLPILAVHSPLHNVNQDDAVTYPSILVTSADHDTRVIPGHSLKYLAEIQNSKPSNKNVFLGRIYENAGHEGGSKSKAQMVEEVVDRLVFTLLTMRKE